jgi:2-dehydropantoate 2-reductase
VIAVVGVGAIGGVCAANLVAAGHDVVCCVRRPFDTLLLESPDGRLESHPRVETKPARVGGARWILFATKAHQTQAAAAWLEALRGADTRLAVLQNGVEHVERLSPWFDPARIVPVVVGCPATATAPGRIGQRRPARLTLPDDPAAQEFAALFAGTAVTAETTADWPTAAWQKLCFNVTGGALAALSGDPRPQAPHPRRGELAQALAHECADAARAEGADVSPAFADRVAQGAVEPPRGGSPSTLTDRRNGRPLEFDARNGAVVRAGARHGIDTPVNARAALLMAEAHLEPERDLLPALAQALG